MQGASIGVEPQAEPENAFTKEAFNGLAICAGIGGIELGLRLAIEHYTTVCYIEREAFAAAVLMGRMANAAVDSAPVWDDLQTFDGKPWRGAVDIVTAGFPCQPFSVAGKRLGTADERWIFPEVIRVVRETEPSYVLLENPKGIIEALDIILKDLAEIGYDAVWDVFSAAETGLPHYRERIFILAYHDGSRKLPLRVQEICQSEDVLETEAHLWQSLGILRRSARGRARLLPHCGFRGMVDGLSQKLERSERICEEDRLRCLGNAVVPAVAALAVSTLAQRIG